MSPSNGRGRKQHPNDELYCSARCRQQTYLRRKKAAK